MHFTLNPGPSQLSEETRQDVRRSLDEHIVSISHRSKRFTEVSRNCVQGLRRYLGIPETYRVFYFDSASQVWHSMAANLVEKNSFHFVNGSFSAKACEASKLLGKNARSTETAWGSQNDFHGTPIPPETELITACYNETSTGVKMQPGDVRALKEKAPDALLAIDLTSCAGATELPIAEGDIWYFSVQKIFGLPAGLGIAIVSPRAYERALAHAASGKSQAGIWGWEKLDETMRDDVHQTPHTPNVLGIYLLGEQCKRWNAAGGLPRTIEATLKKKRIFNDWLSGQKRFTHFVSDEKHRSDTVFVASGSPEDITTAIERCKESDIELGGGYGQIKKETFRIANFPAIDEKMLCEALDALTW